MPTLHVSQFLIESSICLLLFYGFYGLVLRKETFFQLNRLYLLVTPLLSIAIPLIHVELYRPEVEPVVDPWVLLLLSQSAGLPDTLEQSVGGGIRVGDLLLAGYVLGLVLMLFRLGMAFRGLRRLLRGDTLQLRGPAASFFGHILHRTSREDSERELLDAHERVHVREGHSLDILFMELMIAGYWFHPLIYGFRRQLKLIHEFIADARVVGQTGTRYAYARLLVRYSRTPIDHPLLNTFASFTKKRLLMLNQSPSPAYRRLKYLLALPLFICLLGLFSFNLAEELPSPILEPINVATATLDEVGQYELTPILKPEAKASLVVADTVPASAKKNTFIHVDRSNVLYLIDGERVTKNDVDDLDPKTIDRIEVLKGEQATIAYGEDGANGVVLIYTGAKKEGNNLDPKKNILIKSVGSDSVKSANIMIRRVDKDNEQVKSLLFKDLSSSKVDGQKIVSGVITNEEGTPLIGASVLMQGTNQGTVTDIKGKFSMVVPDKEDVSLLVSYVGFEAARINLDAGVNSTSVVYGKSSPVDSVHTATFRIRGSEDTKNPLIILNGEPQPQVKKVEELGIDPEEIASVNVVKISVGDKIGESLGRDVIEITTKDHVADRQTITINEAYLYVVDGEVVDQADEQDVLDIPPSRIESVNVLKGESAIKKYGDKGKNGVVEITTKKTGNVLRAKEKPAGIIELKSDELLHDADQHKTTATGKAEIRIRGNDPDRPLFVIDGVKMENKDETNVLKSIDPNDIESINVLKDESATEKYGEDGKNGVVEIVTKSKKKTERDLVKSDAGELNHDSKTLFVIDGVPQKGAKKLSYDDLDPNDIASTRILKGKIHGLRYGLQDVDQVVEIKTKSAVEMQNKSAGTMVRVRAPKEIQAPESFELTEAQLAEQGRKNLGFKVFPNPSDDVLNVFFEVPGKQATVNVSMYNSEGRLMKVLRDGTMSGGKKTIQVNKNEINQLPGTYWVRLVVDGTVQTKQVVFN